MSGKDKWVRRFSVDETAKHNNGFTIYKITSVLFPIDAPEAVTVVSVWKRYSEVRRLHRGMLALHAGLHLPPRGMCTLPSGSYFRRFTREVIEERARAIKRVLEFVAEHRLLFTSTEFVNFLQSGHAEPAPARGAIDSIRAALRLSPSHSPARARDGSPAGTGTTQPESDRDETDLASIPRIPIYEAAGVEVEVELEPDSASASAHSLNSLDSLNDDLFDELSKLTVENKRSAVKKRTMLPDLINFDAPSSSRFEDYHTMRTDTSSMNSSRSNSRMSLYSKASLSNAESKTRTEDSYVFEAGYMLNMAARSEDMREYQRAFDYYKSGIEKMLIGVQTDADPQRRALIKRKTGKYLARAELVYNNHLCGIHESLMPEPLPTPVHCPVPLSMLRRPYEELALYRVLAVLADTMMLVLHKAEQACYAMKVIQKIPNNLTEFDEYFLQRTNETRQPVLPTSIPYMVPLHAYIETNSLIFLILTYAPGEKLFDYIKNYVKSIPTTPAREVNLENVFSEPLKKEDESSDKDTEVSGDRDEVEELVKNSQKLLKNVDRVLKEEKEEVEKEEERGGEESPAHFRVPLAALPASALRGWAAQILTALESLHNAGVICRHLNPAHVLLGDGGRVVLTYRAGYPAAVSRPRRSQAAAAAATAAATAAALCAAPELYAVCADKDKADERVCDYWSFGVIMYELLCGVPLSHHHKSVFTSHTLLALPEGLPVEEQSLLTQLLTYDPAERLGRAGIEEIKQHPYFRHVCWQQVYEDWRVPG